MLRKTIITNNPLVRGKYGTSQSPGGCSELLFVEGSVEETLIKVRDLVYEGYELISHPLPASLRILFSPYRSIIIGENKGRVDSMMAGIAEESVSKYKRHMSVRKVDQDNDESYQMIDLVLLESALQDEQGKWQ